MNDKAIDRLQNCQSLGLIKLVSSQVIDIFQMILEIN